MAGTQSHTLPFIPGVDLTFLDLTVGPFVWLGAAWIISSLSVGSKSRLPASPFREMSFDSYSTASRSYTVFLNLLPFTGPAASTVSTAFQQSPYSCVCPSDPIVSNEFLCRFAPY